MRRETAPANFTRCDEGGSSYVFKQSTAPEEEDLRLERETESAAIGQSAGGCGSALMFVRSL
jgi:hypothetical protein